LTTITLLLRSLLSLFQFLLLLFALFVELLNPLSFALFLSRLPCLTLCAALLLTLKSLGLFLKCFLLLLQCFQFLLLALRCLLTLPLPLIVHMLLRSILATLLSICSI
jgi:hypothetical protein